MLATVTPIHQPDETDAAWAEHAYRQDVVRRYYQAVEAKDRIEAAFVWLEAHAHDKANQHNSPLVDELDAELPAAA
ncbi:hypothetical protein ACIPW5_11355 [Streptomyces sp. NPDC090077]|uniref:hypothetical protein n=1 Tax=Streptomyces sp. NPDC090077 TaxID=3365938 RepID=UPI0038208B4E